MGIRVEFNPDLTLRNISHFKSGERKEAECIPEVLEVSKVYPFLKKDQRNYWLHGEIPLLETQGNEILSRPKASVIIKEATHILENNHVYTKGFYEVVEVYTDDTIHFEGFSKVGSS